MEKQSLRGLIFELKSTVHIIEIAQETNSYGGKSDYSISEEIINVKNICSEIEKLIQQK